jgi:hypothetical protein
MPSHDVHILPAKARSWYRQPVPRTFSPDVLRLAEDLHLAPEEVDDDVFQLKARTWEQRRMVLSEEQAIAQVGLVLGLAQARTEELVKEFLAAGAVIPELPARPRWGLRRPRHP